MHVSWKSNLASVRLLSCPYTVIRWQFTVGLLRLGQTVPVCRMWKFSCPLISDYLFDENLVNLRAWNIIGEKNYIIQNCLCGHGTCAFVFLTKLKFKSLCFWEADRLCWDLWWNHKSERQYIGSAYTHHNWAISEIEIKSNPRVFF